jgi:cobalt-zinc-cadmium efflux system membrane fusion protein
MGSEKSRQVRSMRIVRLLIFAVALVLGCLAIALARHYKRPEPKATAGARGMTVSATSVALTHDAPMWSVIKLRAAEPAAAQWTPPVPARIVFDETRASRMGSPLPGRVATVLVARGQHVAAGDDVFTVSSPHLAELRADLAKARFIQTQAQATFKRLQSLSTAGVTPHKELVNAQEALDEANLAVELARQKLKVLRASDDGDATYTVTAPRDGVVVELNLAIGQEIDPTSGTVVAIADLSVVWVVADLFEDDVGALCADTPAKVLVGSVEHDGIVDQVSSIVDRERHTVPVRVKLPNPDGALRPNAYAQIRFFAPTTAKVAVPASAVMSDGEQNYVYVQAAPGVLKRRNVVVGPRTANQVPIVEGLSLGELVVVQGAILLDNQIQIEN